MRQSVQALAVVTLDVPAAMPAAEIADNIQWALANAKSAPCFSVSADVRAIREEAAMFNSNGDQWTVEPGNVLRQGGDKFRLARMEYKDGEAVTGWSLSPAELNGAARDVAEALNFMAGRVSPPDAAASETLARRVEELESALQRIHGYPASENSEPDDMGDALVAIFAIAEQALGESIAPSSPPPPIICGECGNDGDEGLTIGIDGVWDAETGRWTLHYNGEGLDCSACDYRTRLDGNAFPDGLEISPDGGEVLL